MKKRYVIIVGGGIAGLTLARLLTRDGHQVTVLERAKDFSAQGHAIGLRGVGFQVFDKLGLKEAAVAAGRGYSGNTSYTFGGQFLRTINQGDHADAVGGIAVTKRGILHAALVKELPSQIDLRFGIRPTSIREEGEKVIVGLSDGSNLECDILVGADGGNSAVRTLALPDVEVLDFGGVYVGMEISIDHGFPVKQSTTFFGKARMVIFFPTDEKTVSVVIYQHDSYGAVPNEPTVAAWRPYLKKNMRGLAPQAQRVLDGLKEGDSLFFDRIRQIPVSRVVAGRVALVGDSGYCPTFFSGNGAALACLGAYCFSECLEKTDDDCSALQDYQSRIVPQAAAYQTNANRLRSQLFSRSPIFIALRELIIKYAPMSLLIGRARRHYRGEVKIEDVMA